MEYSDGDYGRSNDLVTHLIVPGRALNTLISVLRRVAAIGAVVTAVERRQQSAGQGSQGLLERRYLANQKEFGGETGTIRKVV